ncbi:hypothetical protein EU537_13195 [Candidatus Thorarchaeota archaeon]|nr:MAG: hypothetical protein EU537_13195 [Candidatus Thorarchaeota archaeon]
MKYWVFVIVILLLVVPSKLSNRAIEHQHEPTHLSQDELNSVSREWSVHVAFVNYQQHLIDESSILENLPTSRSYTIADEQLEYSISYDITFASQSYASELEDVIMNSSFSGMETGSLLDEDALEHQKAHPNDPQRIFYPRDGRVIDAYLVEDWIHDNPVVEAPKPGYVLYFLNYSKLDSSDHSIEHWYDYHPADPDSEEEQDWFRLEWDNSLNPSVELQYPAFGGRYNFFVIDPSADQWYLRWARIWWDEGPDYSNSPEYCTKDLEDKMNSLNPEDPQRAVKLSRYLNEWAYDPVNYLFFPNQNSPTSFVDSGFLKGLVFAMDVDDGVTVDSLRWVTDAYMQQTYLEQLLPFIDWEVDIEFLDIAAYPDWDELFWDHATESSGKIIVDGLSMFNDIYENMRYQYVDIFAEDINVFGVVFIKKNMEMHVYGRQYTGLGGGGQTCIWKSWERYYRADGVTPKSGISSVQLHETMHAIGIGHTWDTHHYVGDFSLSPMGYFASYNGTGAFDKNWVQSTFVDQMEVRLASRYQKHAGNIEESALQKTAYAHDRILQYWGIAHHEYSKMNWSACHSALKDANDWLTRAIYSMYDQELPVIKEWAFIQNSSSEGQNILWAKGHDNLSGVDNVTAHIEIDSVETIYVCENHQGNWSTGIGAIPSDSYVRIWVKATDWAMNSAFSDVVELGVASAGLPFPEIIIVSVAILTIAAALFVWQRRRARPEI